MDLLALALGIAAGLVQLAGYWQYHKTTLALHGHTPNAASWFMWGVGGFIELAIFAALVRSGEASVVETVAKDFLPTVCALVAIVTFVNVWRHEHSIHLTGEDWFVISLDVAVVAVWLVTRNVIVANSLLGIDMCLSFRPILKSVRVDPRSESPIPWHTWTVAYALLTLVVIIRWESGWELIYPGLYLILHGAVWRTTAKS